MNRQHPFGEADLAALEHRSHSHGELFTAVRTLPDAWTVGRAMQRVMGFYGAAMRANRAGRPAQLLQIFSGFIVVGEVRCVESVHT